MTPETYYRAMGAHLFPQLQGRPVMLKRWPLGVYGPPEYQRDRPVDAPSWVRTVAAPRRRGGEDHHTVLFDRQAVLRWAASTGPIEFHPFHHRAHQTRPAAVFFDLDPGPGADLLSCALVARCLRDALIPFGLRDVAVKTSGSKGLHLAAPVRATYPETAAFARWMAHQLEAASPSAITAKLPRALRSGKVFIDWTANGPRRTLAAPYTWRHTAPRPLVSMPVTWDLIEAVVARRAPRALEIAPESADAFTRSRFHGWWPTTPGSVRLPAVG